MAARIRSKVNAAAPIDEASRDDLADGDIVSVEALDAATTYFWELVDTPEGSTATFSGNPALVTPGAFTVDKEGPYLVRLTVDATLATEGVQYVRLRRLTDFGQLTLVSAGERRDGTGIIPVDIDTEGWAHEQNSNLTTLLGFIKPLVSSGRILYVDANDGTTNYADYPTVQDAIDYAVTQTPSDSSQWVVVVRPGLYTENVAFAPYVHVLGWPGNPDGRTSEVVVLRGLHTASIATGQTLLGNLHLENNTNTSTPTLTKAGAGTLRLFGCRVESNGTLATQGPAVAVAAGFFDAARSYIIHTAAGAATRIGLIQNGPSTIDITDSSIQGPNGVALNTASDLTGVSSTLTNCRILATAGAAVVTLANLTVLDHCLITSSTGVFVNPTASGLAGDVRLDMLFCRMAGGGDVSFNITGIGGTTTLNLGSLVNPSTGILFPGGAVSSYTAQTISETHHYDNTTSGLVSENVQDALDELAAGFGNPLWIHKNIPEIPSDTVRYRGWAPINCEVESIRVYMHNKGASVGTYLAVFTNEATGNSMLVGASFDMNGGALLAATPLALTLTGTPADLAFSAEDRWTAEFTSNNIGFDGVAIYFEILFREV